MQEIALRELVQTAVREVLRQLGTPPASSPEPTSPKLITEADLQYAPIGSKVQIPQNTLLTPSACDLAQQRKLTLVVGGQQASSGVARVSDAPLQLSVVAEPKNTVALGADHGGLAMKEDLKKFLQELGYVVLDCGTNGTQSVDYPDFAHAVAKLVAEGQAARGIMVDGAGIGSCMAANKVPGVRAAMCYDLSTAINSREHNDANVLTLGGGLLGANLARQIVKTWLSTEFAGGRHAGRVNKIMAIEKHYLGK